MKEYQTGTGVSDQELFTVLPSVLSGQALEWFRLEESVKTFAQFSKSLIETYRPHNFQDQLLREAFNRKQGKNEDILSFMTHIRMIFG